MQMMPKGPRDLITDVLDQNLCTGCGLCVALCPNIIAVRERIAVIRDCGLTEGLCYAVCPRTETNMTVLETQVFGGGERDIVLGHYNRIVMSRALDREVRAEGQYGGTVTALATLALERELVDGVGGSSTPQTRAQ